MITTQIDFGGNPFLWEPAHAAAAKYHLKKRQGFLLFSLNLLELANQGILRIGVISILTD